MSRTHLFEFEDQAWFPRVLRDAATAYLRAAVRVTGHARLLAPKLAEALRATGEKELLDLCSGGAGPIPSIVEALEEEGVEVRATLTDKFPNLVAFEEVAGRSSGNIGFSRESVDATALPADRGGFRTLFNSFHHFRPEVGRHILASAARSRRPIAVFELVGRSPAFFLAILASPLAVWLLMPTVRPVRASWLFFTYLVPLVPLLVVWDGLVSCLRTYSVSELRAMTQQIGEPGYHWDIGRIRLGPAPVYATYLIGMPRREAEVAR